MNAALTTSFVDRLGWAVLSASFYGTLVIALVLAAGWAFRRRLHPAWRHALWLVVLVRLLVPAVPAAHFHPFSIARFTIPGQSSPEREMPPAVALDAALAGRNVRAPREEPATIRLDLPPAVAAQPQPTRDWKPIRIFVLVWAVGVLAMGAWTLAVRLRLARMLRGCREAADPRLLDELAACRRRLGVRRRVRLCVSDERIGPALAGLWRPTIVLPSDWAEALTGEQLRFVLLHELIHVRRFDPWSHALAILARALHCFNPAVWLAVGRMHVDCELACDAAVLRAIGHESGAAYGRTILRLVERFVAPQSAAFGISDRRSLHTRIAMIAAFRPAKPTAWLAGLALFVMFAAIGWTRAAGDPPAEKPERKAAPQVALDKATQDRVETALATLRTYDMSTQETSAWAPAIRELIEIGKPAVPLVIVELDKTERNATIRALAFVLRGIGDPRAIPALIRAFPRTFLPSSSDYGLNLDGDPELLKFMQRHDMDDDDEPAMFSYGRPFREVVAALRKLSGVSHWEMEINFANLAGSARQRQMERELYRRVTKTWADWWTKNWPRYVHDPAEAEVDLTLVAAETAIEVPPATGAFPVGPDVEMAAASSLRLLPSYAESPDHSCLDLDTGRYARPPAELVDKDGRQPSKELLAWAAREGVDLIGVRFKLPGAAGDGRWVVPVGLRVRDIGGNAPDAIVGGLKEIIPLDVPGPAVGKIPHGRATFAFVTRDGACGFLYLNPGADQAEIRGAATLPDRGMRYDYVYTKPADDGEVK